MYICIEAATGAAGKSGGPAAGGVRVQTIHNNND